MGGSEQIDSAEDSENAHEPRVVMDATGNAIVVWLQDGGAFLDVWTARYDASNGTWSIPELLDIGEAGEAGDAGSLRIAEMGDGDAVASWQQHDGERSNIWAIRYDAVAEQWLDRRVVETDDGNATDPVVAGNANGEAAIAWAQKSGSPFDAKVTQYDPTTETWSAPETIESDDAGIANPCRHTIAMDDDGAITVLWGVWGADVIWANRYDPTAEQWGTATEVDDEGSPREPWVAMDANSNAMAVWRRDGDIRASFYDASKSTWEPSILLEQKSGAPWPPIVEMADNGDAFTAWLQEADTGNPADRDVMVAHYDASTGSWNEAEAANIDYVNTIAEVAMATNGRGNAMVAYRKSEIWTRPYSLMPIASQLPRSASHGSDGSKPDVAVGSDGTAIAVWEDLDDDAGTNKIRASRYQ